MTKAVLEAEGEGEAERTVSAMPSPGALNVDDDGSMADAVDKVLAENGGIDVLVDNAGVGGGGSVEELPMGVFRQVMETNFSAVCAASRP